MTDHDSLNVHTTEPTTLFSELRGFNRMYNLPLPDAPTLPPLAQVLERISNFRNILKEEMDEADALIAKLTKEPSELTEQELSEVLAELADWFGDISIYSLTEMLKYGLDPKVTLGLIMASNRSKLGADGKPIYDVRGKVLKGPNYWKPEPMIAKYIAAERRQKVKSVASNKT